MISIRKAKYEKTLESEVNIELDYEMVRLTTAEVYMSNVLLRCLYTSFTLLKWGGGGADELEEAVDDDEELELELDHRGRKAWERFGEVRRR